MKKGRCAEAKDMNENLGEDEHDKVHKGKILMFARVDKFRSPIKKNMEELKKPQKLGEPPDDAVVVKPMTAMEIRSKIAMICGVAVR
ncbi:hypothetical protein Tco_1575024, partial [Tanacetum coccineum]